MAAVRPRCGSVRPSHREGQELLFPHELETGSRGLLVVVHAHAVLQLRDRVREGQRRPIRPVRDGPHHGCWLDCAGYRRVAVWSRRPSAAKARRAVSLRDRTGRARYGHDAVRLQRPRVPNGLSLRRRARALARLSELGLCGHHRLPRPCACWRHTSRCRCPTISRQASTHSQQASRPSRGDRPGRTRAETQRAAIDAMGVLATWLDV
jgi:hypothetical protein